MNPDTGEGYICEICGKPFTEQEWEDRHSLHEEGCDNKDMSGFCDCDLVAHEDCCPCCNGGDGDERCMCGAMEGE